ncbi:MAG: hypothetical protein ABI231_08675 [Candidatus Tumulicola sp.]
MSHSFAYLRSSQGNAEAAQCRAFLRAHFSESSYAVAAQRESVGSAPARVKTPAKRTVARPEQKRSVAKRGTKRRHRFLGILFVWLPPP